MLEAATAEINHLDRAFRRMAQKDVLESSMSIGPSLDKWDVLRVSNRNGQFDGDA
jgi:hypothetical protein